jgi:hypothetical protein
LRFKRNRDTKADSEGNFQIVELSPGTYAVKAELKGFRRTNLQHVIISVAQVASLTINLVIGDIQEEVIVTAGNNFQVDTISTEVGNVITTKQIEQLALVGRNVMDLAQLSPGVQLRDGGEIDPTKNNFTIAAFQGRAGRETQVEWDGLSLQDHTVGGTVQNLGLDSVQEFDLPPDSAQVIIRHPNR